MPLDRRCFFFTATGMLAAQTPPSRQLTVGVIGSGARGRLLARTFRQDPAVTIAAVCDVYEPSLEAGLSAEKGQAKAYRNYQALLDEKTIDIVIIATPEHWHHRMLLDALAAGKDVYIEKPLCQTPEQGVELVGAARRSRSVVQVGMQRRSYELFLNARKVVASGTLGAVRMARSWWLNNDLSGARPARLTGPLDWEQWQGPAPRRPLDPDRFANWRFYSEYSGGRTADQGAHMFDAIHILMDASYPSAVSAGANRIQKPNVDTPESMTVCAEYPQDFLAVFMLNYAAMRYKTRNDQLIQLDGDLARMDVGREEYAVYRQGAEEKADVRETSPSGFDRATDRHVQDFIECVRTRKTPTGTVELGFQACLIVQLANMSLQSGRRVVWDAAQRRVV